MPLFSTAEVATVTYSAIVPSPTAQIEEAIGGRALGRGGTSVFVMTSGVWTYLGVVPVQMNVRKMEEDDSVPIPRPFTTRGCG